MGEELHLTEQIQGHMAPGKRHEVPLKISRSSANEVDDLFET